MAFTDTSMDKKHASMSVDIKSGFASAAQRTVQI